ncbi:hypothetical protein JCM17846_16040 [Iodidimonas nitroreducens]|uniref:Pilus assembly protein CpaD n=1 Tax=Iodidimonas nitroreducens TaxID=1236968 RepID=A0A5A7N6H1_9PROT|nr:CpaD family pilus assembly lipoprotein [Iodidimonas nitroreducens]GAK34366.1 pilus (Caulobacter type) biogenesis lipoprotein CpaD [alpha proteobacterium Q-1]GER03922.1 hypothetical protein JCM17846_16040 [Iodidimonas nitroreducens]
MTKAVHPFAPRTPRAPLWRGIGLAFCVGALAACQSSLPAAYDGLEQEARNEVQMVRLAHRINPSSPQHSAQSSDEHGLDDAQKSSIIRFLAEMDAGYGDHISLVAGDGFSPKASEDLRRILRAHGLQQENAPASIGEVPKSRGALLVLDRYIVTAPQCPNSVLQLARNYTNAPSPQFGCANVINLGQMVADPRDLLTGNGSGQTSTGKAIQSLKAWRDEVPIILVPQGVNQGGGTGFGSGGGF